MRTHVDKAFVLNAIALAMGVSGATLAALRASNDAVLVLFGIGIFCLSVNGLNARAKHK